MENRQHKCVLKLNVTTTAQCFALIWFVDTASPWLNVSSRNMWL